MLADHAKDLNLAPGANVFSTRAQNDIIGVVTYATLGPDHGLPIRRHPVRSRTRSGLATWYPDRRGAQQLLG